MEEYQVQIIKHGKTFEWLVEANDEEILCCEYANILGNVESKETFHTEEEAKEDFIKFGEILKIEGMYKFV